MKPPALPLPPVEPRRLYRQIADQLRGLIDGGEFVAGARLPPERDLAAQLGVSRPSVREALIALEVEGRIEVRMGSGIYVRPADAAPPRELAPVDSPLETIRARALIEAELAANAARRMSAAQLESLNDALALMQADAAAGQAPTRGDRLFHLRIAQASDNSVLLRVVGELYDERHNPLHARLGSHFETPDSWAAAIAEHRAIVEAIARRAPQSARAAMARHLARSHDRLTARWPAEAGRRPRSRPPTRQEPHP